MRLEQGQGRQGLLGNPQDFRFYARSHRTAGENARLGFATYED